MVKVKDKVMYRLVMLTTILIRLKASGFNVTFSCDGALFSYSISSAVSEGYSSAHRNTFRLDTKGAEDVIKKELDICLNFGKDWCGK